MPPVALRYIVSFNSQDVRHPVENLQKGDGTKRWLCAPGHKSGQLEAIFQLDKPSVISHIDIGTYWVFTIQVKVGQSSWPQDREFETLLPTTVCMPPTDCKQGKNKVSMKLCKKGDFDSTVQRRCWDRIKVVCSQPFRKDVQFGLSVLRVVGEDQVQDICTLSQELPCNVVDSSPRAPRSQNATLKPSDLLACDASVKSATEIERHFFGNKNGRDGVAEDLKCRLSKIGASSECGTEREARFSRNVQLVLAAAEKLPRYKPSGAVDQSLVVSPVSLQSRRQRLTFEEEVDAFLGKLDAASLDMETVTFADLRHKLEKKKARKLSKEEKKIFFAKVKTFLAEVVEGSSSALKENGSSEKSRIISPKVDRAVKPKTASCSTKVKPELNNSNSLLENRLPTSTASAMATSARVIAVPVNSGVPDLPWTPKSPVGIPRNSAWQSDQSGTTTKEKVQFSESMLSGNALKPAAVSGRKKRRASKKSKFRLTQEMLSVLDDESDDGGDTRFLPANHSKPVSGKKRRRSAVKSAVTNTDDVWLSASVASSPGNIGPTPGGCGKEVSDIECRPSEEVVTRAVGTGRGRGRRVRGRKHKTASQCDEDLGFEKDSSFSLECPKGNESVPKNKISRHRNHCSEDAALVIPGSSGVEEVFSQEVTCSDSTLRCSATMHGCTAGSGMSKSKTNTGAKDCHSICADSPLVGRTKANDPSEFDSGVGDCGYLSMPSLSGSSSGRSSPPQNGAFVDITGCGELEEEGQCPLCFQTYPILVLPQHADVCASMVELTT